MGKGELFASVFLEGLRRHGQIISQHRERFATIYPTASELHSKLDQMHEQSALDLDDLSQLFAALVETEEREK